MGDPAGGVPARLIGETPGVRMNHSEKIRKYLQEVPRPDFSREL